LTGFLFFQKSYEEIFAGKVRRMQTQDELEKVRLEGLVQVREVRPSAQFAFGRFYQNNLLIIWSNESFLSSP